MPTKKLPPTPTPSTFASELISARTERGLTQGQLSTLSGLSLSAIKAYETGRNLPGARELRELCQSLEISPNKLLFGSEFPFKEPSFDDVFVDQPGSELVSHGRVTALLGLVTASERQAVLTLLRSLASARHGETKVKAALVEADAFFAILRATIKVSETAQRDGKPLSADQIAASMTTELEHFMTGQGHIAAPEKLPKE